MGHARRGATDDRDQAPGIQRRIGLGAGPRLQLVDFAQVGYGSAASVLIFVMIVLFTVAYVTAGRRHFQ